MSFKIPNILIIGGGAGGLELAAKLGRKFGRYESANITLVDTSPTHIWKPLLHEIAAGSLNSHADELNYLAFASENFFSFVQGQMEQIEQDNKQIILTPVIGQQKNILIPARKLAYDILIIAVGSVANDFNIPGVREHCLFLDTRVQADFLQQQLIEKLTQLSNEPSNKTSLNITVVGGGATGIELIAELHYAVKTFAHYGLNIPIQEVKFNLIEAGENLLPSLPRRLSKLVEQELQRLSVTLYLGETVSRVDTEGFMTTSGKFIPGDIKVWAAGIKAPDFLKKLGLETNRINQLVVKSTLQTTHNDTIFALGDCASCPQANNKFVPPRAQAAHQQANFLLSVLPRFWKGKALKAFQFYDYGSLISLSHYETIGTLMGKMTHSMMLEGKIARLAYISLYKRHQIALYGFWRTTLLSMANLLHRRVKPRLKLH